GVDLGTAFVAAAVSRPTRTEMFMLGEQTLVMPATVYLDDDEGIITGDAASRRAVADPRRAGRELKRRLGDATAVTHGGQPFAVTDLLGALLRDVLATISDSEGARPDRVVLAHPAIWGAHRRGLFRQVAEIAGLTNTLIVTEPEAVGARYSPSR